MFSEEFTYTKSERIWETVSAVLAFGAEGAYIELMILGKLSGFGILYIVISAIIYGAFTVCSKAPQFTSNALANKDISEEQLHNMRKACIFAKIVLIPLVFAIAAAGVFIA